MRGESTETADLSLVETHRLDCQLGSLHGTEQGPLHVSNSCMAWAVRGAPSSGTRIYPWCVNWLFGAHSLWWDALLSLDAGGGRTWSSLNLVCQTLLTPHGRPYAF